MNNNGQSNNGFSSGFLLGLIIGATLVFLLGTEKGKKVVKTISEGGLDKMEEFKTLLEENMEEVENEYEEPKKQISKKTKPSNGHAAPVQSSSSPSIINRTKRLFKGIPKRK